MSPNEYRKHVKAIAKEYGYKITKTNGGHLRLSKPGHPVVFSSLSSSDHRAVKNLQSQVRRSAACPRR